MSAPVPVARSASTGIMLEEGYQALITLTANTSIDLWEKQVTPPAASVSPKISTTTQRNSRYKTAAAPSLIEIGDSQFTCGYDPGVYTAIIALLGVPTTITVTFPDGSTLAFYGFLQAFTPGGLMESGMVEATVVICCTNWDHVNHVEAGPAINSVTGT